MRARLFALSALCALAFGCADDPEPAAPPVQSGECLTVDPGPSPIRRMTRFEYNNTVRDLLGDKTLPAADFGAEEEALGFNNNAANLVTSSTLAEKYMLAAEGISSRATEKLSRILPCEPELIGDEPCARQFIDHFGARAYRRPLAPGEADMLFALYSFGHTVHDFREGIRMVIEAALQSPHFLYRVELGAPDGPSENVVRLNDWEMASRLSYFLWGTMPDDQLFTAAEAGLLNTKEQVADQAKRMLDDPRARQVTLDFHRQWLDYDRIASATKDPALFPSWSALLKDAMREETERFINAVIFEEGGELGALLTASYTYLSPELAEFYGVTVPSGPGFNRVELDPTERAGLLTMGSLLALNAHSNQTSPVHRGKLVREAFLCDIMPMPPPDAMITVPTPDPNSTARERFAEHSKNSACRGCHELMDPIGFGFESYDAVGRFREEENGAPVDASGSIVQSDINGEFDGAVELAHKLTGSEDVRACYATQWFRYASGRGETHADDCSMAALRERFKAAGGNIQELLVALTQTDAFLYRKAGGAQ
jgi:hypothetical protein